MDAADVNGDGRVDDEETMQWIDLELHGEGWIMPHKVTHPDLGEVWIGGTQKKHTVSTPPSRYIEMEAQKNADFVLWCASQFPKVEIGDVTVTPEEGNLYWVDVEVKNDRTYPTSSDRENVLGSAVQDKLTFRSSDGVRMIPIPEGMTRIDPARSGAAVAGVSEDIHELRLVGHDVQTFRYLVQVSGSGWAEFQIDSFHGGTATRRVQLPGRP